MSNLWLWTYLMNVILQSLTLNVPDEGYPPIIWLWMYLIKVIHQSFDFERTWWRLSTNRLTLNIPDEVNHQSFDFERTWWRLSRNVSITLCLDIYIFNLNLKSDMLQWCSISVPIKQCHVKTTFLQKKYSCRLLFVLLLVDIVLSVLWLATAGYPYSVFKLFFL